MHHGIFFKDNHFCDEEYNTWKFRLGMLLKSDLTDIVENEPVVEGTTETAFAVWKPKKAKTMNVIVRCVDDSHLEYIQGRGTAYGMVKALDNVFQRKTVGTI